MFLQFDRRTICADFATQAHTVVWDSMQNNFLIVSKNVAPSGKGFSLAFPVLSGSFAVREARKGREAVVNTNGVAFEQPVILQQLGGSAALRNPDHEIYGAAKIDEKTGRAINLNLQSSRSNPLTRAVSTFLAMTFRDTSFGIRTRSYDGFTTQSGFHGGDSDTKSNWVSKRLQRATGKPLEDALNALNAPTDPSA